MSTWLYRWGGGDLRTWVVGFFDPQGTWVPVSDHKSQRSAAATVHYLNGGNRADLPASA